MHRARRPTIAVCWYLAGGGATLVGMFVAASNLSTVPYEQSFVELLHTVWPPVVLGLALLVLCSLYPLAGAVVGLSGGLLLIAACLYQPLSALATTLCSQAGLVGIGVALVGFCFGLVGIMRDRG